MWWWRRNNQSYNKWIITERVLDDTQLGEQGDLRGIVPEIEILLSKEIV